MKNQLFFHYQEKIKLFQHSCVLLCRCCGKRGKNWNVLYIWLKVSDWNHVKTQVKSIKIVNTFGFKVVHFVGSPIRICALIKVWRTTIKMKFNCITSELERLVWRCDNCTWPLMVFLFCTRHKYHFSYLFYHRHSVQLSLCSVLSSLSHTVAVFCPFDLATVSYYLFQVLA